MIGAPMTVGPARFPVKPITEAPLQERTWVASERSVLSSVAVPPPNVMVPESGMAWHVSANLASVRTPTALINVIFMSEFLQVVESTESAE